MLKSVPEERDLSLDDSPVCKIQRVITSTFGSGGDMGPLCADKLELQWDAATTPDTPALNTYNEPGTDQLTPPPSQKRTLT